MAFCLRACLLYFLLPFIFVLQMQAGLRLATSRKKFYAKYLICPDGLCDFLQKRIAAASTNQINAKAFTKYMD